jgi:GT2 family glycosyltransferase
MTPPALVTIAIPLFRSAPLVANITVNIDRLTYPNLEILISDRHLADDAIDQLERRYAGDPRVTFLRRHDEANWVTHYNDLLSTARGQYFCWMPHDDGYDEAYIDRLAAALDARPDAILAFGVMGVEPDGAAVPVGPFTDPPLPGDGSWSLAAALRLLLSWELFRVVRGLVRREAVLAHQLLVPGLHQTVHADVCWAFSVAVTAPLVFVPEASCTKRYRAGSASSSWQYGIREAASEWRVMNRTLWRSSHPRAQVAFGSLVLGSLAIVRIGWRTTRPLAGRSGARVPAEVRSSAIRGLSWMLAPRRER